jgi:hypothetical protein
MPCVSDEGTGSTMCHAERLGARQHSPSLTNEVLSAKVFLL